MKFHDKDLSNDAFLITGGAGFIGSNLVRYLLRNEAGFVRVLDNLNNSTDENIREYFGHENFEFIHGDIRDLETCKLAVSGINYISHQAALGSVPRSIKDPLSSNEVNVGGFLNMMEAARGSDTLRKMVYAASSSTYGDSVKIPKVEGEEGSPLSPYAVTKVVNEMYASVYSRVYSFHTIGLRYFNIFGPNQSPDSPYSAVIPKFVTATIQNKNVEINGDGKTARDFTHVSNAVQANIRSLLSSKELTESDVFNVCSGRKISLIELHDEIISITNGFSSRKYIAERLGDVKISLGSFSKINSFCGYEPKLTFREELLDTINYYSKKNK